MMVKLNVFFSTAFAFCILVSTVHAQNPGECPQDDGKYRTTSAGTFLITCYKRAGRGSMGSEPQNSLAACIDAGAAKTGCKSVDYNDDTKTCYYLSGSFIPALAAASNPMYHNARLADRPAPAPAPNPVPNPAPGPIGPQQPVPAPNPGPSPPPNPNQQFVYTTNPTCSQDNNKVYVASDGTYYILQCNHDGKVQTPLSKQPASSYADCMEKCSQTNGCNSIQYVARPASDGNSDPVGECKLYTEEGESDRAGVNTQHDYAYAIDPPTHDEKDFPNQLCTTACPAADGMTYTTSYAETFKMDCGKRHGTTILSWGYADNFQQCMEACGALVACHSVDYQARTRKCYYGTHHGNPLIIAPGFDSAHSVGCAGACTKSCCGCQGSHGKPSRPDQNPSAPDLSCGNQGLEYAVFPSNNAEGTRMTLVSADTGYSAYNPTAFKAARAETIGKTKNIGITDTTHIYDSTRTSGEYVTVNHRGYLFTQQAGEYAFSFPAGDDIMLLWVGSQAYSGYTRANANIVQSYSAPTPGVYKQTFRQGEYVPIRMIYANGEGAGTLKAEIKAPDGTIIIGSGTTKESPFLVQFSCDYVTAPKFPPYGSET